ncbi:MAG: copper amine oxidase N-terminal domain-containing protein [Armatimonadota bacterium]|nr:copper amine oxidase N-terminal domain-containing protein [Armatimonadota bacterium]
MRIWCAGTVGAVVSVLLMLSWAPATGQAAGGELLFDVQPVTLEGRTLVPLRPIFEWLGAKVTYDGGHIQAWRSEGAAVPQVELWIGSSEAQIAEATYRLDVAPQLIHGRCFVPLRFVAESFGVWVEAEGSQMRLSLPQENIEALMAVPPHPQTHQGKIWRVIERWYGVLPPDEETGERAGPVHWRLLSEAKQEALLSEMGEDAPSIVEARWSGREVDGIRVLHYHVGPGDETGWVQVKVGYAGGEGEIHRFDFVREPDGWKVDEVETVDLSDDEPVDEPRATTGG